MIFRFGSCYRYTDAFCEQRVRAALQALCSPDLSAAVIDQTIRLASKHAVDIALPAAILRIKRLVRTQLDEQVCGK
jgi:hypothetical protein